MFERRQDPGAYGAFARLRVAIGAPIGRWVRIKIRVIIGGAAIANRPIGAVELYTDNLSAQEMMA